MESSRTIPCATERWVPKKLPPAIGVRVAVALFWTALVAVPQGTGTALAAPCGSLDGIEIIGLQAYASAQQEEAGCNSGSANLPAVADVSSAQAQASALTYYGINAASFFGYLTDAGGSLVALAHSSWKDKLTITGGTGTGQVTFNAHLSGTITDYAFVYFGLAINDGAGGNFSGTNRPISNSSSPGAPTNSEIFNISEDVPLTYTFTYGVPFTLQGTLGLQGALDSRFCCHPLQKFSADFSHTAILDTVILPAGASLISQSGVSYPSVPTANAGPDQTVNEGVPVALNGSQSTGAPLTYQWTQIAGTAVSLDLADPLHPTFIAPQVSIGGETLTFQLVVNNSHQNSLPDQVNIMVQYVNDPPVCSLAQPSPASLWPPNHEMVPVSIINVADANHDQVVITVTGVTQDEPVHGLGDGDTSPDAVLQGSQAFVRAERSGKGNGRVYEVQFTANDGKGGICNGSVKVSVPHKTNSTAVDSGQLHNSTLP